MDFPIIEKFYENTLSISKHLEVDILKHFQNVPLVVDSPNDILVSFYEISKKFLNTEASENKDLHTILDIEYEVVLFCLHQNLEKTETLDIELNTSRETYLQLDSIALLQKACIINPLSKITIILLENKEYAQWIGASETETIHTLHQLIHLHTNTPTSNLLKHPITPIEYEFITLFETKQHIGSALEEVGFETTVHEGKLIDEDIETALDILRKCIYKKFIIAPSNWPHLFFKTS